MNTFRRAAAEFIGTCVLVVGGCGTAMTVGCSGTGYLLTALAFGLGLLTMAYSIGNISGCHINPALSFAMLILGKMSYKDFFAYILAQNLGALAGSGILSLIFKMGNLTDRTGVYGANGLGALEGDIAAGLIVELVLTFIFVTAVLGIRSVRPDFRPFPFRRTHSRYRADRHLGEPGPLLGTRPDVAFRQRKHPAFSQSVDFYRRPSCRRISCGVGLQLAQGQNRTGGGLSSPEDRRSVTQKFRH